MRPNMPRIPPHPLIRFLMDEVNYGPLPTGLSTLFFTLYGQLRTRWSGFYVRPYDGLRPNLQTAVRKWRDFLAASSKVSGWADRGLLFNPPGGWPDRWPDDWPEHVYPLHLHRAFGANNRLNAAPVMKPLKKWTGREGVPEVMAYVAGVPLTRKQEARARRGARQLLQAPQFLIWAYNVPVWDYPRTDINPLTRDRALHHLSIDPLATEDENILEAIPGWLLEPTRLIERARTFNPLRTRASDLIRYEGDELLGWKGEHLRHLPPPKPDPKRVKLNHVWTQFREPLYLTHKVPRLG